MLGQYASLLCTLQDVDRSLSVAGREVVLSIIASNFNDVATEVILSLISRLLFASIVYLGHE